MMMKTLTLMKELAIAKIGRVIEDVAAANENFLQVNDFTGIIRTQIIASPNGEGIEKNFS